MKSIARILICLLAAACLARQGAADDQPTLPPAASDKIDFHKQIVPILFGSCVKCHANGQHKSGLSIDTRESLLAGGESGPVVVVGQSDRSRLVQLVAGFEPDSVMPAQGPRLTGEQIGLLRGWIDQGLAWEEGFTFRKAPAAPLEPRRPTLPAAPPGVERPHPIDLWLDAYFAKAGVTLGEPADDRTFIRRASLDLVGLLPSPGDVEALAADSDPQKRTRLVERLLADRRAYADHWLSFWNDALRNAYRGTGYIDGGRSQISAWLYQSLYDNKPYDQFVRELLNPAPGSEGFVNGITWRGVVNASQRREVQAAQNVGQVLMGTNLKCASCHDSFVNQWKLTDSYGLAAVFADSPLEIHRCDKPTGQMAEVKFIYPQLGTIDPKASKPERMKQLAAVVTDAKDGRLARTLVNRLWAMLFGRGLVEPVDDLDQPAWHADLLDWLAADFQDHGYDVKRTLTIICTSRAYQARSRPAPKQAQPVFVFRGPLVRRTSAEQFADAVSTVTEVWGTKPAFDVPAVGRSTAGYRAALVNDDALTRALGRPNREQVVTRRDSIATTLQALELTNGTTLDALVKQGAGNCLKRQAASPEALIDEIYGKALGRRANQAERSAALELVGSPPQPQGVADLLWIVLMLPEFQLIR